MIDSLKEMFSNHQAKQKLKRINLGFWTIAGFMLLAFYTSPVLQRLETLTLDYRYQTWASDRSPRPEVVLIDIDDESLKFFEPEYGAWPWPRSVHKKVLEYLSLSQPGAVLFDILFSERQREPEQDAQLSEASVSYPGISHALKFMEQSVTEGVEHVKLPPSVLKQSLKTPQISENKRRETENKFSYGFHDALLPNPTLLEKAPEIHIVNAVKDPDGIFRRGHTLFQYDGQWFPGLAIKGILSYLNEPKVGISKNEVWIEGVVQKADAETPVRLRVPTDDKGQVAYHFYSLQRTFKTYQIGQILKQKDMIDKGEVEDPSTLSPNPLEDFKDKIVLIGASAVGLEDLKATPIHQSLPGVLLHATTISNILDQRFLKSLHPAFLWIFSAALCLLVYFSTFFLESLLLRALVPALAVGTYAASSVIAFNINDINLPMAIPIATALLALLDSFAYMTFVEGQAKKKMAATLSKFLPPEVAEDLMRRGIDPTAEVGKRKSLSILFSDIRGFTTLSESKPAEEIVAVLNRYLGKMTEIIFNEKGTLDKFIGDAVMCFWNAPADHPSHPLAAVKTALFMTKALNDLNVEFQAAGIDPLSIGIGVHTGEAIVGNIGSERRLDYTIIGDNVNLASRLEGLTKQYGVQIIIGPETYAQVSDVVLCRPVDQVVVKGRTESVRIFEPLALISEATPENIRLCEQFQLGYQSYLRGEFELAENQFKVILKSKNDPLTLLYLQRIEDLKINPPLQWTGTYVAKSK